MGKTRNAIDSDECNNSYEDADVETEETDEEEDPSEGDPCEDGPVEENSSEEEQDEADPHEEPEEEDPEEEPSEEDPCEEEPSEEDPCEEEPSEEDPCEEEPSEEDPCEEEPSEEDPCEEEPSKEEPDEDSLHAPNSEKLCEEEPNELLCGEESNEVTSCEEELNKDPSGEGSCEEECGGEPNEEPCEDSQGKHCESEPSEDPEPYEEVPSEGICEEEPSESEVPNKDDGETIKSNSQQKSMLANAMSVPKGNTGPLDINLLGTSRNMSNTEKVDITKDRSKKRRSRWDSDVVSNGTADVAKEKRKTRWSSDNCQLKETAHLKLPDIAISVEIMKLQAQLFQITNKLQARELVDDRAEDKRSPSPPPVYNNFGIKINSREARLRAKLTLQRQKIISEIGSVQTSRYGGKKFISEMIEKNLNYKPPPDNSNCKRPKFTKKLYIPRKENPGYNFAGLIIGPRGNTQKRMENETGAKIYLRGKGSSLKDSREGIDDNDELHVLVEADNQFSVDSAVVLVEKLLTPMKDGENRHKLAQLRELAVLKGNLRDNLPVNSMKMDPCDVCGDATHSTSGCPLTASVPGANINKHEIKFLAEPSSSAAPLAAKAEREIDDANLFVGFLPQTVDEKKLLELFLPFGQVCQVKVIRDRNTGMSKGSGFVRYTDRANAAKAVMHMNGYTIDGKVLAVRIAGVTPPPVNPNAASVGFLIPNQFPIYPGIAVGVAPYPVNPNAGSVGFLIPNQFPTYPGIAAGVAPSPVNPNAGSVGFLVPNQLPTYPGIAASVAPSPVNPNAASGGFLIPNQLPTYPGYAAIAHGNPDPICWPGPPGSVLPEPGNLFANTSNLLPQNPFSGQHSLSSGPTYQPRPPSTLPSADVAASDELAHFPGYLKSFDPPSQLHQPSPFYFTPDSRHP